MSTPLWLPGEGTATQRAAEANGRAIEADDAALHLLVAHDVIALVSKAAMAANARDIAARRLARARALATDLSHRFATGESSQSDALAADAEAATAEVNFTQAEADFASARIALAAVTGSETVPSLEAPASPPVASPKVIEAHPRVLAAVQAVEVARAKQRLTAIQNREDPEIGLEGINEKQPGTRWDTRFGVTFTFHFATEARNAPRLAAAEAALTEAEVRLVQVRREVEAAIGQAEAMLGASERSRVASERAAADLEKRRGQIERAWRLGEVAFIDYVRANAQALDVAAARDQARITRLAALQQLRVAEGMLP